VRADELPQLVGLRRVTDIARESLRGTPVVAEFADERIGGGPIGSTVDRDCGSPIAATTQTSQISLLL
jgi:hypothetical protein